VELLVALVAALVPWDVMSTAIGRVALLVHEHVSAKWAYLIDGLAAGGTASRMKLATAALAFDGVATLIEGWSLWRRRSWAPWFIIAATGGFIPLEVMLLIERSTPMRVLLLVVNVATVAYLLWGRLRAMRPAASEGPRAIRSWRRARWLVPIGLVLAYAGICYALLPWMQRHRALAHTLERVPDRAYDAAGQPRDPLNVGLVGARDDVFRALRDAGWVPAKPLSDRSGLGIAESVVLDRSDPDAPVSTLFVDGRRQDLAFEQQVGGSPRHRHHVRFWRKDGAAMDGREVWVGAATYDRGVGLARDTGQITHVIDRDIDRERDKLIGDLLGCGCAVSVHRVPGVGRIPPRRSGIYTDGYAAIAVLAPGD
jgi:uncharacterized membrane protein (DUF2068 family)